MGKKGKRLLAVVGAILGIIVIWGFIEPYFIDVEEEDAVITNLPSEMEGEKIAVIGDFQVGLWMDNISTTHRIVEDLIEMDPAAILITGDFILKAESPDAQEIDEVVDALRPLVESGIPTYGVLGNHDYSLTSEDLEPNVEVADALTNELNNLGIMMLENENDRLMESDNPDEDFYIVGIGSHWADNDQPTEAFDGVPEEAPRVVLMHNPDSFLELESDTAPLAVAGHTHGGQIRVPFTDTWSYLSLVQGGEITADGWIQGFGAEGNELYVNRGIGMSFVPIRINAIPEITMFTLTSN